MAIKAGRVGVNPSDVDSQGHILGGGGGGSTSYTKQETDVLLNLKADKTALGGLEFRNNDGTPQVKVGSEWVNFNKGDSSGLYVLDADFHQQPSYENTILSILVGRVQYGASPKLIGKIEVYKDALRTELLETIDAINSPYVTIIIKHPPHYGYSAAINLSIYDTEGTALARDIQATTTVGTDLYSGAVRLYGTNYGVAICTINS